MRPTWVVVGGTFDPIHVGHIHIARAAVSVLGADRAVLAVGDAHPHREPTVLDRDERIALVRAAIEGDASLVEAGQVGVEDASLVSAVRRLARRGRLHVVFGADSAARLVNWGGLAELSRYAMVWAVPRSGTAPCQVPVPMLPVESLDVSASAIRRGADHDCIPRSIRATTTAALARNVELTS